MKGYLLGNMDIEIYLSPEELQNLRKIKSGVSVELKDVHKLGANREAILIFEEFSNLVDGIKVDIVPHKGDFLYRVKLNNRALQEIEGNGRWGSRYGGGEKIIISTRQPPWERSSCKPKSD